MPSFLQRIADTYVSNESNNLIDFCFIFPNKRSGTFFRHYLADNARNEPFFEPEITTISEFVSNFSEKVEAGRYDLLFTMYDEYRKLSKETEDFDKFIFWGDMLMSDFNDVDRYLVNPAHLFKNIKDIREISTDFLSDEQKDIIRQYWDVEMQSYSPEQFWTHINHDGEPRINRESFIQLWEILFPLYNAVRESLSKRGLCYSGMQYREVAGKIKSMTASDFRYKRYIFVGFNVLSTSELAIFDRMRKLGIADFYWDYDLPESIRNNSSATHFLKRYVKLFPSLYDLTLPEAGFPEIEIISVPSNVGQTKLAGKILQDFAMSGTVNPANAIDTAVVLPSEELFIDLLHSIPSEYGGINITMGYPLRLTSVAVLLRNVMSMHLRAKKVRDTWNFFHEDIKDILNHRLVSSIDNEACEKLKKDIETHRMFLVPVAHIVDNYPQLAPIFFPIEDLSTGTKVFDYVENLVDYILESIKDSSKDGNIALETGFLVRYRQSVELLRQAAMKYNVTMRDNTFFHLIERAVNSESVNFVGEPLSGLQVMGVLETRALDFKNIVLLSMNERIFPRKHYTRSFIPNVLRQCYGMSTMEFQECIYAYYFYRLISHASCVKLLYDGRTSGLKGGEMSRYLYQLLYLFPDRKITKTSATFDVPPSSLGKVFKIDKTERILRQLDRYLSDEENKLYLSPSTINQYLQCPLRFYFNCVENVRQDEEMKDYVDESVFGRVVHEVLEMSYKRLRGKANKVLINNDVLDRLKNDRIELQRAITSAVNHLYNKYPSQAASGEYVNLTELSGETRILGELILDFVTTLFEKEKRFTPFYFVEGERKVRTKLPLGDGRSYNIVGTIDRIDEMPDGLVRIVDYKTGSDKIAVDNAEELTKDSDTKPHNKGVLQLFLYCNMHSQDREYDGPIWPMLYVMKMIFTSGLSPVTIEKKPLMNYREWNETVMGELNAKLIELFDVATPFIPSPSQNHCRYCDLKHICGLSPV